MLPDVIIDPSLQPDSAEICITLDAGIMLSSCWQLLAMVDGTHSLQQAAWTGQVCQFCSACGGIMCFITLGETEDKCPELNPVSQKYI
jgi:hypothetical protein